MRRKAELLFIKYCRENKLDKVQSYLHLAEDLGLDINAVDDYGVTAAHWAVTWRHAEVIRLLAATGEVNWNIGDLAGNTPLHLALFGGDFEVAGIIMKQDNVDFSLRASLGWTVAMAAVYGESTRCVELLAQQENCNSWNIPSDDGNTPLMEAIKWKNKDILKILLNCPRVDLNLLDKDGNSAVMKAIKEEKLVLARLLIRCSRVDLGTRDRNGASLQRIARWEET